MFQIEQHVPRAWGRNEFGMFEHWPPGWRRVGRGLADKCKLCSSSSSQCKGPAVGVCLRRLKNMEGPLQRV